MAKSSSREVAASNLMNDQAMRRTQVLRVSYRFITVISWFTPGNDILGNTVTWKRINNYQDGDISSSPQSCCSSQVPGCCATLLADLDAIDPAMAFVTNNVQTRAEDAKV